ncbi:hypothetical protein OK107_08765 [Lacticaseibacillus paracasei]|uniref:hypothetical protein n=1 Tax=Lacticaseibacillus paracasei TaxID=1597 RepID=UPI0022EC4C65|nr:hypothetical protein [Lacticaseibacillus paracasei]WBS98161.1 hypothetical protein OK107_08765 [Lacticaseibacillus paracasei]
MSDDRIDAQINQFRQDRREHLSMIQNTISRMSTNSFLTRGWSVTIFTGLYTLYATKQNDFLLGVIIAVVCIFWLMDSYYLGLERAYRDLYDDVRGAQSTVTDFNMQAQVKGRWLNAMRSRIFLISYVPALGSTILIFAIKCLRI